MNVRKKLKSRAVLNGDLMLNGVLFQNLSIKNPKLKIKKLYLEKKKNRIRQSYQMHKNL